MGTSVDKSIKLRIGAALDGDMNVVYAPLVAASKRAAQQIKANLDGAMGSKRRGVPAPGGAANDGDGGYRTPGRTHPDTASNAAKRAARERAKIDKDLNKELAKGAADREKIRRDEERDLAKQARQLATIQRQAAAETRRNQHIADSAALRVSGGAVRNMGGMVRRGVGVANDIARGAGVDFSLGGAMQRRMSLENQGVDLSNAGFMSGKEGQNGKRQDPKALMADAQRVAQEYAIGADKAMEGMQAFTGKTGDLQTARDILGDMARLSQATGSSMEDMVSAAGEVANALPDGPDKVARIKRTMVAFAGQGKEGAIEIKDQAKQAAKLTSRAGEFAGDESHSMGQMGALVQMARAHGGAANAPQAFTALSSFMNTFSKGARRKNMAAKGVAVKDGDKGLLDAEDIIVQALQKTKGNDLAMGKLFMDANARKVTRGFEQVYNKAGGGKKGEDAVHAEFKKYKNSAMGEGEISDSLKAKLGTTESGTNRLKNQIDKDLGDALEKAAPNLLKLGSAAGKAVEVFSKVAGWSIENPKTAILAFAGAAIVKSFSAEMMRATIERGVGNVSGRVAMLGASATGPQAGLGGVGGAASGASRALGALTAAVGITSVAMTAYAVGVAVIDADNKRKTDKKNAAVMEGVASAGLVGDAARARKKRAMLGGLAPLDQQMDAENDVNKADETIEIEKKKIQARIDAATKRSAGDFGDGYVATAKDLWGGITGGDTGAVGKLKEERADVDNLAELKATLATLNTKMGGTLQVTVVNASDFKSNVPGSNAPTNGREGPG